MKVGDLVRILSAGKIGVVYQIFDCRPHLNDVVVLAANGIEEWEEDELEVISEKEQSSR